MWKKEYDQFITIISVQSSSFIPIVLNPPGQPCTIHIGIYLPTAGQDPAFIEELAELETCMYDLYEKYPGCTIYLLGDFNASDTNLKRADILDFFCNNHNLESVHIQHPTYHHFIGNGSSDSNLDRLLHSRNIVWPEKLKKLYCKLEHPLVNSHHDLLISSISLPINVSTDMDNSNNLSAPVVENKRIKIKWTEEGINKYQEIVTPKLQLIQDVYFKDSVKISPSNLSLCLQSTKRVLVETAARFVKTRQSS